MRTYLILILVGIAFIGCHKDKGNDEKLNFCFNDTILKFTITNNNYFSIKPAFDITIGCPIDDSLLIAYEIMANIYLLNDTNYSSISIYFYNMILLNSKDDKFSFDSIITENFNNKTFQYLQKFNSYMPCGITVELTEKNKNKWYSYNFNDSINFDIDQSNSSFVLSEKCAKNDSLYKGSFSCKLYNNEGNILEIKNAEFIFKKIP